LKYDAFFRAFYIGENDGCLKDQHTTWAIPKFFAEMILPDEESRAKLPQDDFSYDKWFQENCGGSPRNHWKNFAKYYDEDVFVNALMDNVDETNLSVLFDNFEVEYIETDLNKELFYRAIAQQFKAIIDGKGEAENIVSQIYNAGNINVAYMDYIDKAKQRYNVMRLIGGDEVALKDFFVCNTLGEKERVFAEKKQIKSSFLEDPDLQAIRKIYEKRGYDNLKTVLIGSGGCGKSLMLQYLFLKAADEYSKTGILPIFLELRYVTQSDEILDYLVETVKSKDEKFDDKAAKKLLVSGKCQLLLDGFDEIDPSDVGIFVGKLEKFTDKYDKVQMVITTRNNEYLAGLHGYVKLYVWPFEPKQSYQLIDKILAYQGETGAREAVIEYIDNGFLKKDGVFSSHPLLLTYVTMKYPSFKRFNEDPSLFYRVTFDALVSGHDDNKKPYARVFMSVDDATQFTTVFREFCALTYRDGKKILENGDFSRYFSMLKSHKDFKNPHKMSEKNFLHDLCSTACIMYEKEYDLYYIDPGFQECMFADYYANAEPKEILELVNALQKTSFEKLERFDALDMFNKASELKFRFYVLLPFMDKIFKTKDDNKSFMNFLQMCFKSVNIVNLNETTQMVLMAELGVNKLLYPREENYSKTVLLNYVLKDMGVDPDYKFCLYTKEVAVTGGKMKVMQIPKDANITGMVLGQTIEVQGEKCLLIDCKPMDVYIQFQKEHLSGEKNVYLMDDNNELICFGSRLTVTGYDIASEPEEFVELNANVIGNSKESYEMFLRLKEYHKRLKIEKFDSGIN